MIPIYRPLIEDADVTAVSEAVRSGWVSSKGKEILEFESAFSRYIGKRYGVSTTSGTTALHLALSALDIGIGDEVLVTDFTFVSPVNAVIYQGAVPVLVDAENVTWGIDPLLIEKSISKRTKAIIAVHMYGNPAKIDEIREIAEKHDLYLIEDCAESVGAQYNKRKVGTGGIISCFSFYGNKIITTGEGGMCATDDKEIEEQMRVLRDHGMLTTRRYWHDFIGYNYRMTNMQAALGLAQLSRIEKVIARKRELAKEYSELLSPELELQRDPPDSISVFWLYSVLSKNKTVRDKIMRKLSESEIESRPFFYPVHTMPPYERYVLPNNKFDVSDSISQRGLNLPSYPQLTEEDILKISKVVNDAI